MCRPQDDFKPPPDATDPADTTVIWREDTTSGDTSPDPDGVDTNPAECEAGEVRECGVEQGECTIGEQACEDGVWGECSGQGPTDELCDGLDNDCNGEVDDKIIQECGVNVGVCISGVQGCLNGEWAPCKGSIEPSDELCDGFDNNCDGTEDETGLDAPTWFRDADGDQFGDPNDTVSACAQPDGYVADNTDCDDTRAASYPFAPELCDGLDNDCNNIVDDGNVGAPTWYRDADGDLFGDATQAFEACEQPDGYVDNSDDCNDNPAASGALMYPNRAEVCDGLDNNCNGVPDEGVRLTFYRDADTDTFGDPNTTTQACTPPPGYVANSADCDDAPSTGGAFNPNAAEVCDGLDNNCNSQVDEGALLTFYRDADGDTFGNVAVTAQACTAPTGFVANSTDCDDTRDTTSPAAAEVCDGLDNNCNGTPDEGVLLTFYGDTDRDGFGTAATTTQACTAPTGYSAFSTDCNDNNNTIYPGAPEQCDSLDNNCNGQTDEDVTLVTFYRDADGDNFGTDTNTVSDCRQPAGYVTQAGDCNDSNDLIYPGRPEVCDGLDNNCNGTPDEGVRLTFYRDADSDTFGDTNTTTQACTAPTGYVANNTDCNDNPAASGAQVHPGRAETCDGLDNDCDTQVDEGALLTFYRDADSDTFGNVAVTAQACTAPTGFVANSTDCNDSNAQVFPGRAETCDGLDNNCNSTIDEGVLLTFYRDADSDTFGNPSNTTQACTAPAGFVTNSTDCNDTNNLIYPGRAETCDGLDNNCNSTIDEGVRLTFYRDADGDTFGNVAVSTQACTAPTGYVTNSTDCNDSSAQVFPGRAETCDGLDNNCNSTIDEGVLQTFYLDGDADGFGAAATSTQACSAPAGYVTNSTDCNDGNGQVYPGRAEVCLPNTIDDNCNGTVNEGCAVCNPAIDADFDGSNQCDDCNDTNGAIRPGTAERCDGLDNNCNSLIDETFDLDGDGFATCSRDPLIRDCDDTRANVYPGATELCDSRDNNCNGYIDEGCNPCNAADTDGDGVSECGGDCNPSNATVYPGAQDLCDGLDNDCNTYTVENCDVSQPCNFPSGLDVCKDDLLCACIIGSNGSCSGDYRCTSLCNTSATGALGDGCAANQTCAYDLQRSANVHGCGVQTNSPGAKRGGEPCGSDAECRSLNCDNLCTGPGCNQKYCIDYCGSDDYCPAANTTCRVVASTSNVDGLCWPTNAGSLSTSFLGASATGATCSANNSCANGLCLTTSSAISSRYCTEACCEDSDCPANYACSLRGNQATTTFVYPEDVSCTNNSQCVGHGGTCTNGKCTGCTAANAATTCNTRYCYTGAAPTRCAWLLTETSPVCVRDLAGTPASARQAGAACTANTQCASNFCERNLGVCVDVCCSDASCPTGLTCELQYMETLPNASSQMQLTQSRVCMNQSTTQVLRAY